MPDKRNIMPGTSFKTTRKIVLLINLVTSSFLLPFHSKAQDQAVPVFGIRFNYGFIIKHSSKLNQVAKSYPFGMEVDMSWHLRGKEIWQYCFCYPRAGFSIMYTNFDNPEEIGWAVSAPLFIEPFMMEHKKINFSVRFGLGPSYNNKVYDPVENPTNLFFSSHLSFIAMLNFGINYRLNNKWVIRAAANYNHISNGGIKNPNLGINFPTANLGVDYSIKPVVFESREKNKAIIVNEKKNYFTLTTLATGKTETKGKRRYLVNGASFSYGRLVGRLSTFSVGVEWIIDEAVKTRIIKNHEKNADGTYKDHQRGSFLLGHHLLLGKFDFYQELGIYFCSPYPARNKLYQRYGLNFYFTEHFFAGVNLKSHLHNADFLDFRTGITF